MWSLNTSRTSTWLPLFTLNKLRTAEKSSMSLLAHQSEPFKSQETTPSITRPSSMEQSTNSNNSNMLHQTRGLPLSIEDHRRLDKRVTKLVSQNHQINIQSIIIWWWISMIQLSNQSSARTVTQPTLLTLLVLLQALLELKIHHRNPTLTALNTRTLESKDSSQELLLTVMDLVTMELLCFRQFKSQFSQRMLERETSRPEVSQWVYLQVQPTPSMREEAVTTTRWLEEGSDLSNSPKTQTDRNNNNRME